MNGRSPHFIVMTPGMGGADGIAALSRLVVRALPTPDLTPTPVQVVSLSGAVRPEACNAGAARVAFFGAGGSKARFVTCALRAGRQAVRGTWVICLHLHQVPVALPLLWRGARLMTVLCGIEAWKPLSVTQRRAFLRSDIVLTISEHTAQRFREANPRLATRVLRVCHLGVPESAVAGTAQAAPLRGNAQPAPLRGNAQPAALIVGRMAVEERYKGHDLLLEIWPRVISQVPEARLLVAGEGDDLSRLEARGAQLGLREQVTFLGRVSEQALATLYQGCTFFVMPSRNEGFGLVFLEAMRAGKACIGGAGAAAEIIQDGVTGFVVNPGQPEQVLAAVLRLFREPETRERMGRAGAQRFQHEFTEECFQRRFRRLLGFQTGEAPCVA
ncbi:MAG: glycosyltransferase family 4 protein [Candidatus Binatia bacterium]